MQDALSRMVDSSILLYIIYNLSPVDAVSNAATLMYKYTYTCMCVTRWNYIHIF